jgi:hypothetical protein
MGVVLQNLCRRRLRDPRDLGVGHGATDIVEKRETVNHVSDPREEHDADMPYLLRVTDRRPVG